MRNHVHCGVLSVSFPAGGALKVKSELRCIATVAALFLANDLHAQVTDISPRIAALRAALGKLVVQRDSVVVAVEPLSISVGIDRTRPEELQQLTEEAREMATIVGPGARAALAKEHLQCRGSDCASTTGHTVVLVGRAGEPSGDSGQIIVRVSVFSPAAVRNERSSQSTIIAVSPRAGGFTAALTPRVLPMIVPTRVPPRTVFRNRIPGNVRRASEVEQLAFEIVVARHALTMDFVRTMVDFGFDPRIYDLGWDARIDRLQITSSSKPGAHADSNPNFIAGTMGLRNVVDDTRSCAVFRPSECRLGALPGVYSFTRALVRRDEAQIVLLRTTRAPARPGEKSASVVDGWRFDLRLSANEWNISSVRVNPR